MTAAPTIEDPGYFERLADVQGRHWWALGMWRFASSWLAGELRGRAGLRALDIGCGTGETLGRLAALPGVVRVWGLDPSPEALAHRRPGDHFPRLRGSATALPLADASCDVATCFDVLQHLEPGCDRAAIREVGRVLAPGGVAVFRSNGRGWSGVGNAYRLDELVARFRGTGLEVRRASYANCLPALAQEVRGRLGRPGPLGGVPPHPDGGGLRIAVPHPWINRCMTVISTAEALAAGRLGLVLPFGHSTMVLAVRPG